MNVDLIDLKCSGIYLIRNTINDKIYVGQSQNIAKRISSHRNPGSKCTHLYNAIQLYGWDAFEISVLERVDDLSKLTEREQYWMDNLNAANSEIGYNICPVAKSSEGTKHSAETRAKMRIAHQDVSAETRAKMSAANLKRPPVSAEARANMSAARMGHPTSIETRAKIGAAHKDKPMSYEARTKMSIAKKGIPISDEQKAKISATFKKEHYINGPQRQIYQLDISTNTIIETWNNISNAGRTLSINIGDICSCCRGRLKTAGGYKWQYVDQSQ